MVREISLVANCLMCDTYFMQVVSTVDLTEFKGSKGKDVLYEQKYMKIQRHYHQWKHRIQFLHCPTCTELSLGMKYQDFVITDKECVLSLSQFISFDAPSEEEMKVVLQQIEQEEQREKKEHLMFNQKMLEMKKKQEDEMMAQFCGITTSTATNSTTNTTTTIANNNINESKSGVSSESKETFKLKKGKTVINQRTNYQGDSEHHDIYSSLPIYMDISDNPTKPKWELVLGQGPKRIDLDSSRSGRIYKPSLKQLNLPQICSIQYFSISNQDIKMTSKDFKQMNELLCKALLQQHHQTEILKIIVTQILPKKPIYQTLFNESNANGGELTDILQELVLRQQLEQQMQM